ACTTSSSPRRATAEACSWRSCRTARSFTTAPSHTSRSRGGGCGSRKDDRCGSRAAPSASVTTAGLRWSQAMTLPPSCTIRATVKWPAVLPPSKARARCRGRSVSSTERSGLLTTRCCCPARGFGRIANACASASGTPKRPARRPRRKRSRASGPARRTLVEKGLQPFATLIAGTHAGDTVHGVLDDLVIDRPPGDVEHELLRDSPRGRSALEQLRGDRFAACLE